MNEELEELTVRELLARGWHPVIYGGRDGLERDLADAARYRWLRFNRMADTRTGDELDAAIDAAMGSDDPRYTLTDAGRAALEKSK
jgi:hypothetical protein